MHFVYNKSWKCNGSVYCGHEKGIWGNNSTFAPKKICACVACLFNEEEISQLLLTAIKDILGILALVVTISSFKASEIKLLCYAFT